jgi:ubiquinol oxidase
VANTLPRASGRAEGLMTNEQMGPAEPPSTAAQRPRGAMGLLSHAELVEAQRETLRNSRRRYGPAARILFALLDLIYGKARTLSKFKVLELVARVPYQSWEQVAYIAITHTYARTDLAKRIFDRVTESRAQQDNEQWHLLILAERIGRAGIREDWIRFTVIPQLLAFSYYQLSFLLYAVHPAWSYQLNADFEDHAEHEYAAFVAEHTAWEQESWQTAFAADYAGIGTVADLFRQIGYDERVHKLESLARIKEARFR